jgi:hypothetical protein
MKSLYMRRDQERDALEQEIVRLRALRDDEYAATKQYLARVVASQTVRIERERDAWQAKAMVTDAVLSEIQSLKADILDLRAALARTVHEGIAKPEGP